jgi:hypothetical protein
VPAPPQSTTRVKPFICTMPMRLDEGWNQVQFNLADFVKRAYGTNYVETLRVQIHANCRIRRIYFSDRLYSEAELPPEFKVGAAGAAGGPGSLRARHPAALLHLPLTVRACAFPPAAVPAHSEVAAAAAAAAAG